MFSGSLWPDSETRFVLLALLHPWRMRLSQDESQPAEGLVVTPLAEAGEFFRTAGCTGQIMSLDASRFFSDEALQGPRD